LRGSTSWSAARVLGPEFYESDIGFRTLALCISSQRWLQSTRPRAGPVDQMHITCIPPVTPATPALCCRPRIHDLPAPRSPSRLVHSALAPSRIARILSTALSLAPALYEQHHTKQQRRSCDFDYQTHALKRICESSIPINSSCRKSQTNGNDMESHFTLSQARPNHLALLHESHQWPRLLSPLRGLHPHRLIPHSVPLLGYCFPGASSCCCRIERLLSH
jgi:hypothetical protein